VACVRDGEEVKTAAVLLPTEYPNQYISGNTALMIYIEADRDL
jgi:hypothetical protein